MTKCSECGREMMRQKEYQSKLTAMQTKIEANKEEMERLWSAQHTLENGKRWEHLDDENTKIASEVKQLNIAWARRNWNDADYQFYNDFVAKNID